MIDPDLGALARWLSAAGELPLLAEVPSPTPGTFDTWVRESCGVPAVTLELPIVSKDAASKQPGRLAYFGPAYPDAVTFFNPDGVPDLPPGANPSPDEMMRGLGRRKTEEWVKR